MKATVFSRLAKIHQANKRFLRPKIKVCRSWRKSFRRRRGKFLRLVARRNASAEKEKHPAVVSTAGCFSFD